LLFVVYPRFVFNATPPPAIYTLSLHDALPILTRDRILVVEGGLREDDFSGGFSLRARRCWDYAQLCQQHAQGLSVRIDLREQGALARFLETLEGHAGATPVLIEAITEAAVGRPSINGGRRIQPDAALPGLLRSLPGVRSARLHLNRPWAG